MLPHPASRFREAGAGAVMCRALRRAEWQAQSGIWSAAPTQTVQEIALSATNINRSGYPAPDCSNPFDMRPIRERQLLGVGNVSLHTTGPSRLKPESPHSQASDSACFQGSEQNDQDDT